VPTPRMADDNIGENKTGSAPSMADAKRAIGEALIESCQEVIVRLHAIGIPRFGSTITPFGDGNASLQPTSTVGRDAMTRGRN
jgi:hypothetical protein